MRFKETLQGLRFTGIVVMCLVALALPFVLFSGKFAFTIVFTATLLFPIALGFVADLREHRAKGKRR